MHAWLARAALLLAALFGSLAQAQELQPIPALTARVIDRTATLEASQAAALESKLAAFEREAGTQIVVVIVPTTLPEDIVDYTQRLGDAWKIGRRDVGDGLLIVVAKDDRRVRIAPAKALEGAIPDLAARQIIERVITPAFRAGDFAGGLSDAVDQLAARIRGEELPLPAQPGARPGAQLDELPIFFFVFVPVAGAFLTALLGRKLGSLATGGAAGLLGWWFSASVLLAIAAAVVALVLVGVLGIGSAARRISRHGYGGGPPIIWSGGGGGFGGGGFGGGGFSSGGGGDFGGGGASGSW
jgi:uncharacterized protein